MKYTITDLEVESLYRRIKENYTEDIVKKNILCAVDELEDGENE